LRGIRTRMGSGAAERSREGNPPTGGVKNRGFLKNLLSAS